MKVNHELYHLEDKCPDCESKNLLFKALVDANGNFEEYYDDNENEVFCQDCNDWRYL